MEACVEEEADEVPDIASTDARAHPWTVMVMHLNTETAVRAVERARRSDYLAGGAVGESLRLQWNVKLLVLRYLEVA